MNNGWTVSRSHETPYEAQCVDERDLRWGEAPPRLALAPVPRLFGLSASRFSAAGFGVSGVRVFKVFGLCDFRVSRLSGFSGFTVSGFKGLGF